MIANSALADYPTTREEAWRYTPVGEIVARIETAITATRARSVTVSRPIVDALAGSHGGPRIVFVNGRHDANLSDDEAVSGVHIGARSAAEDAAVAVVAVDGFIARNNASGHDIATVQVDPGTQTVVPVHIVHLATPDRSDAAQGTISHPRTVIDVGDGARISIIETYCGLDGPTITNASTTIRLGRDADVVHSRIQTESPSAMHVGDTRIRQAANARLRSTTVTAGADIARHAITVDLAGPGAEADLAGVDVTTGRQRHDTVVTVDHAVPRCSSTQHFRAIVDDHARSSFSGEIIVRPGAAATDAHQSSRNLVLSRDAEADTRPWLQILADDVRCTHGATVGRLDDEALFYLRSRGIPLATARAMLIDAFVHDVTGRITPESLRAEVDALVGHRAGLATIGEVP